MEPAPNALRLRLILGKCPVKRIETGPTGPIIYMALPNGVVIKADLPVQADVREGDLLTLYTEVLASPKHPAPYTPQ